MSDAEFKPTTDYIPPRAAGYAGDGDADQTLLPPNATPLERALVDVITETLLLDVPIRDLWNPLTCPEKYLPHLAWAVSVDNWSASWPADIKRSVIAESLKVHAKKGTKAAVVRAMASIGMDVEVIEWFEEAPPADPYTFRMEATIGELGFEQGLAQKFNQMLHSAKNVRSHLSGLKLIGVSKGQLFLGAYLAVGNETEVGKYQGQDIETVGAVRALAGAVFAIGFTVYPGTSGE